MHPLKVTLKWPSGKPAPFPLTSYLLSECPCAGQRVPTADSLRPIGDGCDCPIQVLLSAACPACLLDTCGMDTTKPLSLTSVPPGLGGTQTSKQGHTTWKGSMQGSRPGPHPSIRRSYSRWGCGRGSVQAVQMWTESPEANKHTLGSGLSPILPRGGSAH